ncbi:pepsin inhibitor-3-like repeated domain-containing protein [Ditylenchus destructor]|nr:pepsin inhibitor-3-like repeated domain-containing protein [Ditylenchus destructor]
MVGYIGPACVVVDDLLYMHGYYIRRLSLEEAHTFYQYQSALEVYRQLNNALVKGMASVSNNSSLLTPPEVPSFCNGLDDTIEVVLDGCTVRNNGVYIADKLIRQLTGPEQDKITVVMSNAPGMGFQGRRKRESNHERVKDEGSMHSDVAALLGHFLNINSSVANRFIPVAKMSPLLSRLNDNKTLNEALATLNAKLGNNRQPREQSVVSSKFVSKSSEASPTRILSQPQNAPADYGMPERRSQPTEIPHVIFETTGNYATPPAGRLDMNDPLLLQLLHSLASQQQSVNHIQQQLTHQNPSEFLLPHSSSAAMKPGDTMVIGGTQYVAVPLSSVLPPNFQSANPATALGLMPMEQQRPVPSPPMPNLSSSNFNWMHPGRHVPDPPTNQQTASALPQLSTWKTGEINPTEQASLGSDQSNLYYNSPAHLNSNRTVRFHPDSRRKEYEVGPMERGLPHEICQAHIMEPFRWSRHK